MTKNEIVELATDGNKNIERAITELLRVNKDGLTNADIANILDLGSSHEGKQLNYLTYSVLGNLMKKNIVINDKTTGKTLYKLATALN